MASAVNYYIIQDTRKNGNGLWYARAWANGKLDLEAIAQRIQDNCSMKRSDVLAYLTELVEVMKRRLADGYRVKLGEIGYFKISMRTKGALSEKKWNISEYCKGIDVDFVSVNEKTESGRLTRAIWDNNPIHLVKVERPTKQNG